MNKRDTINISSLLLMSLGLSLIPTALQAQEPPPAAEAPLAVEAPEVPLNINLSGVYSIWALNQGGFLLGRDHPLNDAAYIVQNFRLGLDVGKGYVGAKLRLDAAQGWWGADNSPNTQSVTTQGEDGELITQAVYNPYSLFEDKDTNFAVHVDQAYVYFDVPHVPAHIEAGRQYMSVGNKLVLDYELDGVDLLIEPVKGVALTGIWAKISEGQGSYKSPVGALMSDEGIYNDADLFGATLAVNRGAVAGELFGLHYRDLIPDHAYFPEGLGYAYSRFQPQVATVTALGASATGKHDIGGGLEWRAEADYLMGTDDIANTDYSGNLIDINDGTLRGYNLLGEVRQSFELAIPVTATLLVGMGSGDEDKTSGAGNINRVQTMGLFHLTNVWEDSVMPDMGGVGPQGLGSPVSRGYRELENTTVAQLGLVVKPTTWLTLDMNYAYLKATQPIQGWDSEGPTGQTSTDLGQEIDLDVSIKIWKELSYTALFGYFIPGEGAGLLINGNLQTLEPAWELKQVLLFKF